MTSILYVEPELVIALNRKLIFVNPNDLQIFKEVEIPNDLTKCGLKVLNGGDEGSSTKKVVNENPDAPSTNEEKSKQQEVPSIQHVALASNVRLLAITTAGQKALLLYQCYPVHAKLVSVRSLARTSSALAFSKDSKTILVSDKSGDCYEYDCVNMEAPPKLLLGHLSVVYDVLWTEDNKYIVTCDRDDKIRITNYPGTHDIHGYCLGHREFVAGMALLDNRVIISTSGDKTARIWDLESGKNLAKFELPAPGIRMKVRTLDSHKFQVVVVLYQPDESVGIYEITKKGSSDSWEIVETKVLSFNEMIVGDLCFVENRLYVTGIVDEHFTLRVILLEDAAKPAPENWIQMVEKQFSEETWKPEDISMWFKKRYDNVSEYLERKKRRIEDKQK